MFFMRRSCIEKLTLWDFILCPLQRPYVWIRYKLPEKIFWRGKRHLIEAIKRTRPPKKPPPFWDDGMCELCWISEDPTELHHGPPNPRGGYLSICDRCYTILGVDKCP